MSQPRCIDDRTAIVGECPLWDRDRAMLWWVDMYGAMVHGLDPSSGATRCLPLEGHGLAAALASCEDGRLLVGSERGLHLLDPDDGSLSAMCDPRGDRPWLAFNDARVDPHGALWVGTWDTGFVEGQPGGRRSVLFRFGPDGRVDEPLSGLAAVNGPAFSPDGGTIYVCDIMAGTVLAAPLDGDGLVGDWRVLATAGDGGGPDGIVTDGQGGIWVAMWQGGRVVRYLPGGDIDRQIALPAPMTLSCCFGGSDLATLFVVTATDGLDAAALERAPPSGRLFAVEPGEGGWAERSFAPAVLSGRARHA